jgi:hypothetical protein
VLVGRCRDPEVAGVGRDFAGGVMMIGFAGLALLAMLCAGWWRGIA